MNYFLYTLPFTKPEFYVWAFCIGFNVAMILRFILKGVESKLITRLFERGALSADTAVTVDSLGIRGKALIRFLLRDKGTLRKTVALANDTRVADKKGKMPEIDFATALFYINEEQINRAESLKKGAIKWYLLPIFCAASVGLTLFVNFMLPIFINW